MKTQILQNQPMFANVTKRIQLPQSVWTQTLTHWNTDYKIKVHFTALDTPVSPKENNLFLR